jgi:hypothetical protein
MSSRSAIRQRGLGSLRGKTSKPSERLDAVHGSDHNLKMKLLFSYLAAFVLVTNTCVQAQDTSPSNPPPNNAGKLKEKTDTDGDGQISDSEKAAMKEKRAKMERWKEKADTDGDGQISDSEKAAVKEKRAKMEKWKEKVDTDGDGQISDSEKAAMKEKWEKMMQQKSEPEDEGND